MQQCVLCQQRCASFKAGQGLDPQQPVNTNPDFFCAACLTNSPQLASQRGVGCKPLALQNKANVGVPAARLRAQSAGPGLFQGMSFWMGSGYKGSGVSPQQLADLLTCAGGQVLQALPKPLTGDCICLLL